jgi:phosphate transport system substrate-binding protein
MITRKKQLLFAGVAAVALFGCGDPAEAARNQIRAVGSSTVYPFVTIAAEDFGKTGGFSAPIVESTGTGGGFKLFCAGVGEANPDLSNASRPIEESERELCKKNGVTEITEIKIGYDGIIVANALKGPELKLSKADIFKALAREVSVDGKLKPNPYTRWSDVNPALPNAEILVYGPPPTSGTRDAFVELVMEAPCVKDPAFVKAVADEKERAKTCHLLREDGRYVESGENDNLIVQKLSTNPNAVGIFGYSFLEENAETVKGAAIDGVKPEYETIASGQYPVSRPLFVYLKNAQLKTVPGLKEFVTHLVSDATLGENGALAMHGLIPLPAEELATLRKNVEAAVAKK